MIRTLLGLLVLLLAFSSCRNNKDIVLLQGLPSEEVLHPREEMNKEYRIERGDNLSIQVSSMNPEIVSLFNTQQARTNQGGIMMAANLYFTSYMVNDTGFINMPIIGFVHVQGKTEFEIEAMLEKRIREYVKDASVMVRLTGIRITMLGEVTRPGMDFFYQRDVSIFDALSRFGDLSDFGDRRKVLVLRATKEGLVSYRINLLDKNILTHPAYYLQHNDLVYIEPLPTKGLRLAIQDYGVLISVVTSVTSSITTIILLLNLLNN